MGGAYGAFKTRLVALQQQFNLLAGRTPVVRGETCFRILIGLRQPIAKFGCNSGVSTHRGQSLLLLKTEYANLEYFDRKCR